MFCDAPPLIIFQFADLAITTRSLPALLVVPLYLGVCLTLCLRRRTLGWIDPLIVLGIVALQLAVARVQSVAEGAAGLAGYTLLAPIMLFLAGYAVWRLAGLKPLERWPWPRFGLVTTLALLITDIAIALTTPVALGKVWQLGGACFRDALVIGPPFVAMVFYWLLDCHSSLVFCSQKCVRIGRCRFGLDGKSETCECGNPPDKRQLP